MNRQFFMAMEPPRATHQTQKVTIRGGKPQFYKPELLKEAERKLRAGLAPHRPARPVEGPVRLLVKWIWKPAKGTDYGWKTTRPDTDNIQKAMKDIMSKLGFWVDDAQVCSEIIEKIWGPQPGIFIQIEELDP